MYSKSSDTNKSVGNCRYTDVLRLSICWCDNEGKSGKRRSARLRLDRQYSIRSIPKQKCEMPSSIFEELSDLWSIERSTRMSRKRIGCKSPNRKPDRAPRHRAGGGGPIKNDKDGMMNRQKVDLSVNPLSSRGGFSIRKNLEPSCSRRLAPGLRPFPVPPRRCGLLHKLFRFRRRR